MAGPHSLFYIRFLLNSDHKLNIDLILLVKPNSHINICMHAWPPLACIIKKLCHSFSPFKEIHNLEPQTPTYPNI